MKKLVIKLNKATYKSLTLQKYVIKSDKLKGKIRIAHISDLHSCYYGEEQRELLSMIDLEKPDVVVLTGDFFDDHQPHKNAMIVAAALSKKYPVFYVTGNNEYRTGHVDRLKMNLEELGINVLSGTGKHVEVNGEKIFIAGIDDFMYGSKVCEEQLKALANHTQEACYNVLLAHRPEQIRRYKNYHYDLILSGHAHGGQWRVPGLINGVFAPNQGFFPKYAGGLYQHDNRIHIVSRGLANETTLIPRLFNPPELVIIDVLKDF